MLITIPAYQCYSLCALPRTRNNTNSNLKTEKAAEAAFLIKTPQQN